MSMEMPEQPKTPRQQRIAELKQLIAANSGDLETAGGQDAIDHNYAVQSYAKELEQLEREEQGN